MSRQEKKKGSRLFTKKATPINQIAYALDGIRERSVNIFCRALADGDAVMIRHFLFYGRRRSKAADFDKQDQVGDKESKNRQAGRHYYPKQISMGDLINTNTQTRFVSEEPK